MRWCRIGGCQAALLSGVVLALLGAGAENGYAATPKPQRVSQVGANVYYGGVYLVASSIAGIEPQFPQLFTALTTSETGPQLHRSIFSVFKECAPSFAKVNLTGFTGELAPNDSVVMACGFTGEEYFSESAMLGDREVRNVRAYLGGALLLQNFQRRGDAGSYDIKLLASYPFSLTCIGLVNNGESPAEVGGRLLKDDQIGLQSDSFERIVTGIASNVAPVTGLGATLQVHEILVSEKAFRFVTDHFGGHLTDFRQWLAGELGAQLSATIGVPIIPFAEDSSTRRLAVMMENGSAYNISLPTPDFYADVQLHGFSRKLAKQTTAESLWVYGAYGKVSIREVGSGTVRWEKELKAGVPKKVAASTTRVDHGAAEFVALLALLESVPRELLDDKQARPLVELFLK